MEDSKFNPYDLKGFVLCCNRARLLAEPPDPNRFLEEYTKELQDFMTSHPGTDPEVICFDFEEDYEMRYFTNLLEHGADKMQLPLQPVNAPQGTLKVNPVTTTSTSCNMKAGARFVRKQQGTQVRTRRARRPNKQKHVLRPPWVDTTAIVHTEPRVPWCRWPKPKPKGITAAAVKGDNGLN